MTDKISVAALAVTLGLLVSPLHHHWDDLNSEMKFPRQDCLGHSYPSLA